MLPFLPRYLRRDTPFSQILAFLPSYGRATALTENYVSNLSWFLLPADELQIREELLPAFYPSFKPMLATSDEFRENLLAPLALLFGVFACGSAADLTQEMDNPEGETFDRLSRCAVGLCNIFEDGSLEICQTMLQLSVYEMLSCRKFDKEGDWRLTAFGLTIGSSVSRPPCTSSEVSGRAEH